MPDEGSVFPATPTPMPRVKSRRDAIAEDVSSVVERREVASSPRFEQLVQAHIDLVWRSLRRYGVPPADVDDATQQVFLVASDKLDQIAPGKERPFLFAVASRVALHARRSYARLESARERFAKTHVEGPPDPEQLTLQMEARDLLDRVLDYMPDEERAVFVLFELEEMAVKEIAEVLEVTEETVIGRLRRARVVFKKKAEHIKNLRRRGAL